MNPVFKKHIILIIEDEISLRTVLRDKFTRENFFVLDAKDGEIGLSTAQREQPHIIILDRVMPKMDGMTMLKNLRAGNEWSKNVPIIFLTNLGNDDKIISKEITDDKNTHYLIKSDMAINDLVEKVREILSLT